MTQTAQTSDASDAAPHLRTGWGWVLAGGILFIVVGLLALVEPRLTSLATAIYFGATLLVAGGFALIGGLLHIREHGGWLIALIGLLSILAGILLAFNPFAGAISLVWAIGLWIFVGGVFELAAAFSLPFGRGWLAFVGVVDIVLGSLIYLMKPESTIYFLTFFVSVSLLIRGMWTISLAMYLRRLSRL